jgi:hypothetical protein
MARKDGAPYHTKFELTWCSGEVGASVEIDSG